jgi:hypothetical protein
MKSIANIGIIFKKNEIYCIFNMFFSLIIKISSFSNLDPLLQAINAFTD